MRKLHAVRVLTGELDGLVAFKLKRRQTNEAIKDKERNRMREPRARRAKRIPTLASKAEDDAGAKGSVLSSCGRNNYVVDAIAASEGNPDALQRLEPLDRGRHEGGYSDSSVTHSKQDMDDENSSDCDWKPSWHNRQQPETTLDDDNNLTLQSVFVKIETNAARRCAKKTCTEINECSDTEELPHFSVRRSPCNVKLAQNRRQMLDTGTEAEDGKECGLENGDKDDSMVEHERFGDELRRVTIDLLKAQATAARQQCMRKLHACRMATGSGIHDKLTAFKLKRHEEMKEKKRQRVCEVGTRWSEQSSAQASTYEDAGRTQRSTVLPPNEEKPDEVDSGHKALQEVKAEILEEEQEEQCVRPVPVSADHLEVMQVIHEKIVEVKDEELEFGVAASPWGKFGGEVATSGSSLSFAIPSILHDDNYW